MTTSLPGDIFHVGQVLNNTYVIDKILGRGGTGEVYRARNKITDRTVAIKALNRTFSGNADYVELMKREEEMRAIQHPAVVRYTECSMSDDNHVFLVMDYVEGPPLSDVMANRRLDPRELLIIGHRVAEGLVATHAQGIIHRDLSPDNVILRDGDPAQATIIDFGIAKDTAAGARTVVGTEFAGKYEYSAPEQLDGHVDQQSDIYALGATLLAAWRGETPFLGATPGEIVRRKQSVLDTEGVPAQLKAIIDRMTAPEPKKRPASAKALAAELDGLLRPEDEEPIKRRSKLVPALVGLALVAGVGGWFGGTFDGFTTPSLPHAEPYRLSLSFDHDSPPVLTAHAPNEDTATRLRDAVSTAMGASVEAEITLATGLPSEAWNRNAQALIGHIAPLSSGTLNISDLTAQITGLAVDVPTKASIVQELDSFGESSGWNISADIAAGPLVLPEETVLAALHAVATCGPLTVNGATDGAFALKAPVTILGNVAKPEDNDLIAETLRPFLGERPATVATQILNPSICLIRQALGQAPTNIVGLSVTDGDTGDRNLSGVFTTDQNPVVDVLIPEKFGDHALWVVAVNPEGNVFNVIPNAGNEEKQIDKLAELSGGLYRIRALHSIAEFRADTRKLAFRITDGNFGKSDIVAILSREPLQDGRRPGEESTASTVQALETLLVANPDSVIGVASVIIDARPD